MPAGLAKVEVVFLIDADGILKVSAKELRSGVTQTIDVQPQYGLTDAQVEQMLLDSMLHAKDDIARRALVEARTEAEQMLEVTQRFLNKHGAMMSEEERALTHAHETAVRAAIAAADKDAIHAATEAMNVATKPFAERLMDAALKAAMKGMKV